MKPVECRTTPPWLDNGNARTATSTGYPRKVAFLSRIPPSDTGAGGPILVSGCVKALQTYGLNVHVIILDKDTTLQLQSAQGEGGSVQAKNAGTEDPVSAVLRTLRECEPDVVWVSGLDAWPYFEPLAGRLPHVLYLLDRAVPTSIIRLRSQILGKSRASQLYTWGRQMSKLWRLHREELRMIQSALTTGVVASFLDGEAKLYRRTSSSDGRQENTLISDVSEER